MILTPVSKRNILSHFFFQVLNVLFHAIKIYFYIFFHETIVTKYIMTVMYRMTFFFNFFLFVRMMYCWWNYIFVVEKEAARQAKIKMSTDCQTLERNVHKIQFSMVYLHFSIKKQSKLQIFIILEGNNNVVALERILHAAAQIKCARIQLGGKKMLLHSSDAIYWWQKIFNVIRDILLPSIVEY